MKMTKPFKLKIIFICIILPMLLGRYSNYKTYHFGVVIRDPPALLADVPPLAVALRNGQLNLAATTGAELCNLL